MKLIWSYSKCGECLVTSPATQRPLIGLIKVLPYSPSDEALLVFFALGGGQLKNGGRIVLAIAMTRRSPQVQFATHSACANNVVLEPRCSNPSEHFLNTFRRKCNPSEDTRRGQLSQFTQEVFSLLVIPVVIYYKYSVWLTKPHGL